MLTSICQEMCYKLFNTGYLMVFWPKSLFEHPSLMLCSSPVCTEWRGSRALSQPLPSSATFSMCTVAILECCTSQTCLGLTKSHALLTCRTVTLGCAPCHAALSRFYLELPAHLPRCQLRTLQPLPGTSDREVSLGTAPWIPTAGDRP